MTKPDKHCRGSFSWQMNEMKFHCGWCRHVHVLFMVVGEECNNRWLLAVPSLWY